MGVETVKSFNHYSERIQLSTESRKLPANINDKDRQQQQSLTTKTEPHQHLLKRLPTSSRGIKSRASVEAFNEAFDWLLNHVEDTLPTYRVFFYWSALKNDQVSDCIVNPIEKVSEFLKGLALGNH